MIDRERMQARICLAILNGEKVYNCSRGAFALPTSQTSGTEYQKLAYAQRKAAEILNEIFKS